MIQIYLRSARRCSNNWRWALSIACAALLSACHGDAARPGTPAGSTSLPAPQAINNEPMVRVRIAPGVAQARLDATAGLLVGPAGAPETALQRVAGPVTVTRSGHRFIVRPATGTGLSWAAPSLTVRATGSGAVAFADARYPGALVFTPALAADGRTRLPGDDLDVVNHVPLDSYLPGVLERELYGSWEAEAFAAQAVAARSYFFFERALRSDRPWDLESTTASQVYGGAATNPKAIDAVRRSRGQVLTHGGKVVPAFYSACCGGVGQDARVAFTHHGSLIDMPPLRGTDSDEGCAASPHRTWPTLRRETSDLARRLAAWGAANRHPVSRISGLRDVQMSHRSNTGRPAMFLVTDAGGQQYQLAAEAFRAAVNFQGAGLPPVDKAQQLKSSFTRVTVHGSEVHFTDGRGFGHGVGLCQWGAQGWAKRGWSASQILGKYYPGAQIEKAY